MNNEREAAMPPGAPSIHLRIIQVRSPHRSTVDPLELIVGDKVRREKALDFSGCNSRSDRVKAIHHRHGKV
jgi:hypothetical protein